MGHVLLCFCLLCVSFVELIKDDLTLFYPRKTFNRANLYVNLTGLVGCVPFNMSMLTIPFILAAIDEPLWLTADLCSKSQYS